MESFLVGIIVTILIICVVFICCCIAYCMMNYKYRHEFNNYPGNVVVNPYKDHYYRSSYHEKMKNVTQQTRDLIASNNQTDIDAVVE